MIELKNVSKQFNTAEGSVDALKNVSVSIPDGDIFGIIGMSGAGKSTLVRCINMLERPSSGSIEIDGVRLETLPESKLREVRREITMIFQGFNLLMQRNCLKNVCLCLRTHVHRYNEHRILPYKIHTNPHRCRVWTIPRGHP